MCSISAASTDRSSRRRARSVTRIDAGAAFARQAGGIQADEDALPVDPESFDLIVSAGVLDSVNDVPGALAQIRRALRPDGLFLGAFVGGGSLSTARAAFREAEADRPAARFHPMIDVRSAGDLLVRAGFALPVADGESVSVRYPDLFKLIADLRGMAASNVLRGRVPLTRRAIAAAAQRVRRSRRSRRARDRAVRPDLPDRLGALARSAQAGETRQRDGLARLSAPPLAPRRAGGRRAACRARQDRRRATQRISAASIARGSPRHDRQR